MKKLLIATSNLGKLRELRGMLEMLSVEVVGLDFFDTTPVAEDGATFVENARLKAAGYARQTGVAAVADDSGLEVNALGGRPGVLSARYAGEETDYPTKIGLLLREIEISASTDRRARFVSAVAIADEAGRIVETKLGTCDGKIALLARGSGGFGYDPIFIPQGFDQTFGELSDEIKAQISHRARAFREIIPYLQVFMAN